MFSYELAPAIEQYEFSEDLAKDIIKLVESDDSIVWDRSLVGHGDEKDIRTSDQMNFDMQAPFASARVKDYFVKCVNHYMEKHDIFITQDEGLTLLRYSESKKYDFHADGNWSSYRVTSALIYLNPSEYEGGETYFKLFDLKIKPEKPALVLFPSNYAYIHAAMPVTKGTKYIFVSWMNDLPMNFNGKTLYNLAGLVGINGASAPHHH